jgi:TonB family protein
MSENQSSKTWIFVLAGAAVLCFSIYWPSFFTSIRPVYSLATVVSSKGTTEWISRHSLKKQKPKKSLSVALNESLATGSDGEMVLRFKKGAEIKLLPNTFVTLIKKANATLIAVRHGDIEVIKEGEARSVLVAQEGQDHALGDYQTKEANDTLMIDTQTLDTVKTVETNALENNPASNASEPLRENAVPTVKSISQKATKDMQAQIRKMIADRMGTQKNHLFRCYTSLIQKEKTAHGRVDVHFSVSNQGKLKDPTIVSSDIKDPKFEKCLLQIIKRTDFQPFEGPSVSTLLPLRFEKNLNTVQ